jgi:hypothetical protein
MSIGGFSGTALKQHIGTRPHSLSASLKVARPEKLGSFCKFENLHLSCRPQTLERLNELVA